ncbi:MAG: hypothetical protein JWN14_1180, partial [Chthonomonadales bacterium]|nr:hypothetical protein [Chthonomonadales bacterium]
FVEAFLEDQKQKHKVVETQDKSIELPARMATYLIMRREAPEKLTKLRRYPAQIRITVPDEYKRIRLAKHLYFIQEMAKQKRRKREPFTSLAFTEYPWGPYTKQIESVEEEAVRQGWLERKMASEDGRSSVSYALGPNAEEAVEQLLALLGEEEPQLDQELVPLDQEKTVLSERWATVHFAWSQLRIKLQGEPSYDEVQTYVHNWKPDRAAFSDDAIYRTYRELKLRGLLNP